MKLLIVKLLIALSSSLACSFLSLQLLHIIHARSTTIFRKKEVFGCRPSGNLILGSSHTFYGLRAGLLGSRWFNYACVAQSITEDMEILKYLNAQKVKIDTVIVPIDLLTNTIDLHLRNDAESTRSFAYSYAYNISYKYPDIYVKVKKYLMYAKVLSTYFISSPIFFYMQGASELGISDCGDLVYCPGSTKGDPELKKDAIEAVERHTASPPVTALSKNLISLISYCNDKKIKMYFVAMPVTDFYIAEMKKKGVYDSYLTNIAELERLGCTVFKTFDLIKDHACFNDSDHLNGVGRDYFSTCLKDSVYNPVKIYLQ